MLIRRYASKDQENVIQLWAACGLVKSWNDPVKDIQRKLQDSADGFFVGEIDKEIIASIMVGYDGHRGWVNYLAVADSQQKNGYGRALMQHAESWLHEQGCPKLNLQVRETNAEVLSFYEAIGYEKDATISFGKRLIPDD